jgi:outer membrane protein OmpA-like peptidoglycan-associated protein
MFPLFKFRRIEMRSRVSILAVAALALSLTLASAGFAQQASTSGTDSTSTATSAGSASASGLHGSPTPFPAAPAADKNKKMPLSNAHIKPGTDYPHWELFAGYSFLNFRPGPAVTGAGEKMNGGSTSLAYYLNHWFGLEFDFGGYHTGSLNLGGPTNTREDATGYSFLGGPKFAYRNNSRFTPFAQVLFGADRGNQDMLRIGPSRTAFAMTAGGGLDIMITKHVSWRVVNTEYMFSKFTIPGSSTHQNNIRVSSGLLFNWGARPVMVNRNPTAQCSAEKQSVTTGSGEAVPVHVSASDPDGDSLTYSWTASGGRVDGTGADARWMENNAGAGNYTITAKVDDGHGGSATCSTDVRAVTPPPPPAPKPPVMSCSVDRGTVMAGERVSVTATATSPQNFTLTYAWRANAGQVVGTGTTVQFDTTGLAPGSYVITGRADDGHGQAADCTANVSVQQPPAPPQATKINECAFKPAVSARVDNVCKRVLDDVALRLQNEPKGTVVVVGFADPKDKRAAKLSTDRANNAQTYLVGKGIDKSRIVTRAGTGQEGAGAANHRVDIIWVPDGASY